MRRKALIPIVIFTAIFLFVTVSCFAGEYTNTKFPAKDIIFKNIHNHLSTNFEMVELIGKHQNGDGDYICYIKLLRDEKYMSVTTARISKLDSGKWILFWEGHMIIISE